MFEVTIALLVGAVVGTGAHALWGTPSAAGAPVQVAGATMSREGVESDDVQRFAGSVVALHASGCGVTRQGTGVLVRDVDGSVHLVSNAHVVAGSTTVRAVFADGTALDVAVLGSVRGRDAALMDPDGLLDAGAEPIDIGAVAGVGDRVSVVGFPAGQFRAEVADVQDEQLRAGYGSAAEVLLVGVAAEGGHSGGAVLDSSGDLVGLIAARDPGSGRIVAYRIGDVLGEPLGGMPRC